MSYLVSAAAWLLVAQGCAAEDRDASEEPPAEVPAREQPRTEPPPGNSDASPPAFTPDFDSPDAKKGEPPPVEAKPPCQDPTDPGGSENVAKALPETDDCDNDFKTVTGVASGAVDVDLYKLSALDQYFCTVEPDFEAVTPGTELCVYARCKGATDDAVTGCAQGVMSTNTLGMKGCCAAAPGHATPTLDCSGASDDADFLIRVAQVSGSDQCLAYSFRYHF